MPQEADPLARYRQRISEVGQAIDPLARYRGRIDQLGGSEPAVSRGGGRYGPGMSRAVAQLGLGAAESVASWLDRPLAAAYERLAAMNRPEWSTLARAEREPVVPKLREIMPPETGWETGARVVGALGGEALPYVYGGGAIRTGLKQLPRVGRFFAEAPKVGPLSRRLGRAATETAKDVAAYGPIDVAAAARGPEFSSAGGLAEMTDSPRLREIAEHPLKRAAFEVATGGVADAVMGGIGAVIPGRVPPLSRRGEGRAALLEGGAEAERRTLSRRRAERRAVAPLSPVEADDAKIVAGPIDDVAARAVDMPPELQDDLNVLTEELAYRQARSPDLQPAEPVSVRRPDFFEGLDDPADVAPPVAGGAVALRQVPKALRAMNKAPEIALSQFPEVEKAMQVADGLQRLGIKDRTLSALDRMKAGFARTFEHIDPKASPELAQTQDILRTYLNAPHYSKTVAAARIADVVDGLDKDQTRLLTGHLALPDILKDAENGLYEGRDLPFGYRSVDEARQDMAQVSQRAFVDPAVRTAIQKRNEFVRPITEELVNRQLLPKEVLDDPRYYHRQVMAYMDLAEFQPVGTDSKDIRLRKKGFQRARVGGGDFNLRYGQAEFEWVAQALSLIERQNTLDRLKEVNDLGPALREADPENWRTNLPEGHRIWRPKESVHFRGPTVQQNVIDQVLAGTRELEADDVQDALLLARGEEWVIPDGLAKTLDDFHRFDVDDIGLNKFARYLQSSWKQYVLLNPIRVLKYNVNNTSGDLDVVLAYNARVLKRLPQAGKKLREFVNGEALSDVQESMEELVRLGVIDSGISVHEIPDISEIGVFRKLGDPQGNAFQRAWREYWDTARGLTTFRENLLRVAAYDHFLDVLQTDGRQIYGASKRHEIDALASRPVEERAAKLARELIGDYGGISAAGRYLRSHVIPFWSWMEINAPRYVRLFQNAPYEGVSRTGIAGAAAKRAGLTAIGSTAKLTVQAGALYAGINLWNHMMFPDEERTMRMSRDDLHLILGRRDDGTIRSLRFEGALSDALSWVGLDDPLKDVQDVVSGDQSVTDKIAEAVKSPGGRILQSWDPFTKAAAETIAGGTAYPRITEEGAHFTPRLRPLRNRWEPVAGMWSLRTPARIATGQPRPPGMPGENLVFYRTDPGQSAYFEVRKLAARWREQNDPGGAGGGGARPTPRSNALYYFKRAIQYGDREKAEEWLGKYAELGGTERGYKQSMDSAHPLSTVNKGDRRKFMESLDQRQLRILRDALQWYGSVYQPAPTN